MSARTKEEIAAEVTALRALKPVGKSAEKTAATIGIALEVLTEGIDTSAAEFNDLSDDAQSIVHEVENWKAGLATQKPSESFEGLVSA